MILYVYRIKGNRWMARVSKDQNSTNRKIVFDQRTAEEKEKAGKIRQASRYRTQIEIEGEDEVERGIIFAIFESSEDLGLS
jgi:hypothetical protein